MQSSRGNNVPNQFEIEIYNNKGDTTCRYFQSYQSIIVMKKKGETYLDKDTWNYSITTSKYRGFYLGESTAETKAKIKSGEYKLKNLN